MRKVISTTKISTKPSDWGADILNVVGQDVVNQRYTGKVYGHTTGCTINKCIVGGLWMTLVVCVAGTFKRRI